MTYCRRAGILNLPLFCIFTYNRKNVYHGILEYIIKKLSMADNTRVGSYIMKGVRTN
jgi:hypothetical protein